MAWEVRFRMNVDEQIPLRTLLVEDNRSEAALVSRLMMMASKPRFEVVTAHQLGDALEALESRRFDLVVLDLGLPDVSSEMEGLETIHEAHPDVPIVVLTGVEPADDLYDAAVAAGAVECLFKEGIGPEVLHEALRRSAQRGRRVWADTLRVAEAMKRTKKET